VSVTEQLAQSLQGSLNSGQLWFAVVVAFLGGLLTSFTPCVYPLIPITIRYFGGASGQGRRRATIRATAYVLGMVALYATIGTVTAASKAVFGSLLASPFLTAGLALFCVAMGASMLGLFSLQLPTGLNTRLSQVGGQSVGGALLMGLVSGLIAAPCTGPVLAVILTLVATTGAVSVGFALMVAFGLGLGLPFMALALFSGSLSRLPQSGPWMELVKSALATAMFVVATYYARFAWPAFGDLLERVPDAAFLGLVLSVTGVFFSALHLHLLERPRATWFRSVGVALLTLGVALAAFGGADAPSFDELADSVTPARIVWDGAHDAALARAKREGRPVMIDFTADWCEACQELEHETYVNLGVRAAARRFVTVQIDATNLDETVQKLFDHYGVLGLPTIVFLDPDGRLLPEPRITGFVPPARFLELLGQVRVGGRAAEDH